MIDEAAAPAIPASRNTTFPSTAGSRLAQAAPAGGQRFCLNHRMDAETAARRWADTWSRAWPQRDIEAIAALYASTAVYRSPAFGQLYSGLAGVRRFSARTFRPRRTSSAGSASRSSQATAPRSNGGAAGRDFTFAGVTVLRFNDDGKVVRNHRDYDNHVQRREAPYTGW